MLKPEKSWANQDKLFTLHAIGTSLLFLAAAAAKSFQWCLTLCDPIDGSPPGWLPNPWDSPGKTTGVGCHVLLQCMEVKSEREGTQLCPTLSDPMDCSLPGSSIHGIFQARVLLMYLLLVPNLTGKQACFGCTINFYLLARNYKDTTLGFLWAFLRFPKV